MLAEYDDSSSAKLKQVKLVNSDLSITMQFAGNISSKNNIIWVESDPKDMQELRNSSVVDGDESLTDSSVHPAAG